MIESGELLPPTRKKIVKGAREVYLFAAPCVSGPQGVRILLCDSLLTESYYFFYISITLEGVGVYIYACRPQMAVFSSRGHKNLSG